VISWQPPSDSGGQALTAYEVSHKLATDAETAWAAVGTISDINVLIFTHSGLSTTADVQYRVRAQSGKGFGSYSLRNTFVLAGFPTVTAAPSRVTSERNSITVEW
jgi:hypothetical protein